ncbi:MAG: hypothetical protein IPK83_15240 [Planctomycetes bacterium]|nr:hypothetical protein [Planctomycetota bacterium]
MLMRFVVGLCLVMAAAAGCESTGVPLVCSNALSAPEYGFELTVPAAFQCADVLTNPTSLSNVGYREASTNRTASVQVNMPQNGTIEEGVNNEMLGSLTNDQGFTFERQKVTLQGIGISYVAGTTLDSGNILFVTVSGGEDDPALLETLDAIIATVAASS